MISCNWKTNIVIKQLMQQFYPRGKYEGTLERKGSFEITQ